MPMSRNVQKHSSDAQTSVYIYIYLYIYIFIILSGSTGVSCDDVFYILPLFQLSVICKLFYIWAAGGLRGALQTGA